MARRLVVSVTLFCSATATALPEQCIQDPGRTEQCPRLIYKSAMLTDKNTGQPQEQLVCICLADFEDLLVEPDGAVAKSVKRMRLQSLSARLGISEKELKALIRY